MTIAQIHVDKSALDSAELVECETPPLAEGAVRLKVESFSVTANNITYAVVGDSFGYWNFFPAPQGMGIVPMWGHAEVIESRCADIPVGERVYGYLPMATQLDVVPGDVSPASFSDVSPHRQPMNPVYNHYARLAADPEHDPAHEAERMIFGPLFRTGFIIEYFMARESWFGAESVILTSASSKTAMGLASVAQQTSPDIKRVGLTSPGNIAFCTDTGLYDEVRSYEDISTLPIAPAVLVDFAGNAGLLAQIHHHLDSALKYSCLVGMTHIEERGAGAAEPLPGPAPTLFFAPDHFIAFFKEHGRAEGAKRAAASWNGFLQAVSGSVQIERLAGLEAARATYLEMIAGHVDPARGIVIAP